ncbi:TraB family protein [Medicago truncatula]|uniref:TraB family protein n=2 Tax=Medicago truncatula TaxID=3880 RepID=A0A072UUS9_MEDTR|nr:TraB family protein [Medicago truncatula]
MSKTLPTVMETLVHERDQYMSYTLLKGASESRTVVAVVGRMHLEGMKNNWKQPVNIEDLQTIPPPKPIVLAIKIFTYVGVVVAGVAIISSFCL